MIGVIIQINHNRGFAFVKGPDGLSRFFHVKDWQEERQFFDELFPEDFVEFVPKLGPRGPIAVNVKLHEPPIEEGESA